MKRIKRYFLSLGLDYRKQLLFIFSGNLLIVALDIFIFLYFKNPLYIAISVGILLLFDIFLIRYYSLRKEIIINDRNNEFISLLSYFEIFVSNGLNVYASLSNLKKYASIWLDEKLSELLETIDYDKTIKPYITFSKNFTNPLIENVMVSIYQMVEQGESSNRFSQFEILFNKLSEMGCNNKKNKKSKELDNLSIYPLVATGFLTLLILFAVFLGLSEVIVNV